MQTQISSIQLSMSLSIIARQKVHFKYLAKLFSNISDLSEKQILDDMDKEYKSIIKETIKLYLSDIDNEEIKKYLKNL